MRTRLLITGVATTTVVTAGLLLSGPAVAFAEDCIEVVTVAEEDCDCEDEDDSEDEASDDSDEDDDSEDDSEDEDDSDDVVTPIGGVDTGGGPA